MRRYVPLIIPIVALIAVVGGFSLQSQRLSASPPKLPKPPVYAFDEAMAIAQASLPKYMASIGANVEGSGFNNEEEKTALLLVLHTSAMDLILAS